MDVHSLCTVPNRRRLPTTCLAMVWAWMCGCGWSDMCVQEGEGRVKVGLVAFCVRCLFCPKRMEGKGARESEWGAVILNRPPRIAKHASTTKSHQKIALTNQTSRQTFFSPQNLFWGRKKECENHEAITHCITHHQPLPVGLLPDPLCGVSPFCQTL
jgi:hypothetical protein